MVSPREAQYLKMVADFPASPLGHYSLGKFYFEEGRYPEAVRSLSEAVKRAPDYAAALLALGHACAAAGERDLAKETFTRAESVARQQDHPGMAEEAQEALAELAI